MHCTRTVDLKRSGNKGTKFLSTHKGVFWVILSKTSSFPNFCRTVKYHGTVRMTLPSNTVHMQKMRHYECLVK